MGKPQRIKIKPQRVAMQPIHWGPASQDEIREAVARFKAEGGQVHVLPDQKERDRSMVNVKKASPPFESMVPRDLL